MATNKHATIRYLALDKCFRNFGRKFFIEDLIHACNNEINEISGIENGVKKRQIFDDIRFMESEQGWSIPLERMKDGKRVYYRYSDRSFSIKKHEIRPDEAEQLKETLTILSRFKGMPQFEWIEEMQIRLEDTFGLKKHLLPIVVFEQNPYVKGLCHFTKIYNAIQNEIVLSIDYKGYRQDRPYNYVFHPWFLKQYNNRWFLFGYNDYVNEISNFPLDRIIKYEELNIEYKKNNYINIEEYFDDVVGVTVKKGIGIETVIIKINERLWPYIESKPLHGSQKIRGRNGSDVLIELRVQINHELIALLFSFVDSIEVIEPELLRKEFKRISSELDKKYISPVQL